MWEEGKKLIEPEYSANNRHYPAEYSRELGKRLWGIIQDLKEKADSDPDKMIHYFRRYRIKVRDFLMLYDPEIPETDEFNNLKKAIETYWDEPEKLLSVLREIELEYI